jgi:hypothetical protein
MATDVAHSEIRRPPGLKRLFDDEYDRLFAEFVDTEGSATGEPAGVADIE